MTIHMLVYPMFAMAVLTFGILVTLFRSRARFVREGDINITYFDTYQEGSEPEASAKLSRHFVNLFEAPTLFYVACLAAMVLEQHSLLLIVFAWMYVVLRFAHAYVHTGRNKLIPRIIVYFSSWAVLMQMWASIVFGVATSNI